MKTIVEAMARAMFVSTWADQEEEEGRCYPGQELMDVAPATPEDAIYEAYRLVGHFEALNNIGIGALFVQAMVADGHMRAENWSYEDLHEAEEEYAYDFGHYLAMRAIGSGVAWEDSHTACGIIYPHFEYQH